MMTERSAEARSDDPRSRILHLLDYLDAVRALREAPIRQIADYGEALWWLGTLPEHDALRVGERADGTWLQVDKVDVPPPPAVPEILTPFIGPEEALAATSEPQLTADFEERLDDDADRYVEVVDAYERWLDEVWRPWAEDAALDYAARDFYRALYDLRLRLAREEETVELVWGHGVLTWRLSGETVNHPLVTHRMQILFDPDTGTMALEPTGTSDLEVEILRGLGVKAYGSLLDKRDAYRHDPRYPFDEGLSEYYETLLGPIQEHGRVEMADTPGQPGARPIITTAPVLFIRRRATLFRRFFETLREGIESGQLPTPAPLAAIVADEPSALDGSDAEEWENAGKRLLMPKPTNPEQEQIARRLADHRGVTVQGPPGTGKTHTIANLVSHLIAHGKRVLVTSHKEQPLAVLRDMVPEGLRDLCVAVLGSSAAHLAQLDQSVQAVYERAVGLGREAARRRIAELEEGLDLHRRQIQQLRARIFSAREAEWSKVRLGGRECTPSELGAALADRAHRLAFIPDRLDLDAQLPLTGDEIVALYGLAGSLNPEDVAAATKALPDPAELPRGAELRDRSHRLRELRGRLAEAEGAVAWGGIDAVGEEGLQRLRAAVNQAADTLAGLEEDWVAKLRDDVARSDAAYVVWRDHAKAIREGVEGIREWRASLAAHQVELPEDGLPAKATVDLLTDLKARFEAGRGVPKIFNAELRRVHRRCLVDGEPPRAVEDVERCLTEVRIRRQRYELVNRWNNEVVPLGGQPLADDVEYPERQLERFVATIESALLWEEDTWPSLQARLSEVEAELPTRPSAADLAELTSVLETAAHRFEVNRLTAEVAALQDMLAQLDQEEHASALTTRLLAAFSAGDFASWDDALDEVRRLRGLRAPVEQLQNFARRLGEIAPLFAARIVDDAADPNTCGTPQLVPDAWWWRQGETWLQAKIAADDPISLQRRLESELNRERLLITELASESAWLRLAERLTDAERAALTGWAQALQKVGKGTGKYASRWRAVAQREMRNAQAAIPVWIMPTYRVVESFDASSPPFDVVIVDESSQSDIFSLAVLGIAKKAVVVGDDKQISPQTLGFANQAHVHELAAEHLTDVPRPELLDTTSSLYDVAKRTFPGVIMLKEHFRCLPEIIEFSNQLSYAGKILPLREESSDRDWQPLVDVHLEHGYREPNVDTNPVEANWIVETIKAAVADPRYAGRTFGVISLLGDEQAKVIEGRLIDELGEVEMERRQIRCGNAYHFQGDERHVVFLSLVVAEGDGIGAMTSDRYRQRINVAASRAQDQLICVHSIHSDQLNPDDVRARLIRHCQQRTPTRKEFEDLEARCESQFERDVLREILARGYRVLVQHKVGAKRIDIVVEGKGGRLAVECDGDAYHGPERWEEDRNRQAILERLGWTFFRVRGSAFYRDPQAALAPLWKRLTEMRIRPADADEANNEPQSPPAEVAAAPAIAGTNSAILSAPQLTSAATPAEGAASGKTIQRGSTDLDALSDAEDAIEATDQHSEAGDAPQADESGRYDAAAQRPAAAERTSRAVEPALLAPFIAWTPRPLPDPEGAAQKVILAGLVEIVAAEGPMLASRAYRLYIKAAGRAKVGKRIRQVFNRAVTAGLRAQALDQIPEPDVPGQAAKTLFIPGTPDVVVRQRGNRHLEEIPRTEVIELMRRLLNEHHAWHDDTLCREVLTLYERQKMTAGAAAFLSDCAARTRR